MKRLSLVILLAIPSELCPMAHVQSRSAETRELDCVARIDQVEKAVVESSLTEDLVKQNIIRPFFLDTSHYYAMLKRMKTKVSSAADAVLKEGAQQSVAQIENAYAGVILLDHLHTLAAQSCLVRDIMAPEDRAQGLEVLFLCAKLRGLRDTVKKPAEEVYDVGIARVHQAVLAGTLTAELVYQNIQSPSFLDVSQYIRMLKEVKSRILSEAKVVTKEGAQPTHAQIENAYAGVKLLYILHEFAGQSCIVRDAMAFEEHSQGLEVLMLLGTLCELRHAQKG